MVQPLYFHQKDISVMSIAELPGTLELFPYFHPQGSLWKHIHAVTLALSSSGNVLPQLELGDASTTLLVEGLRIPSLCKRWSGKLIGGGE